MATYNAIDLHNLGDEGRKWRFAAGVAQWAIEPI
jgi:hypothetical protein